MEMLSSPQGGSKQAPQAACGFPPDVVVVPEESEERDVWPLEMGDDSVFYSDEEETHRDKEAIRSWDFGTKHFVNSVGQCHVNQSWEEGAGNATARKEDFPKDERTYVSDPRTCEELPQPECTTLGMQTQQEPNKPAEKVGRRVKEAAKLETQTSTPDLFDVFNEEGCTRVSRDVDVPEQPSSDGFKKSEDEQLQEKETEGGFQVQFPENLHRSPPPHAFDHLTSSKYSTVSYRRIRRGNTREKIKEFEFMLTKQ